jgi:prolyl-tRNA synthetase
MKSKVITPRSEDYAKWYADCVREGDLAEHAPVKGCMVIRPHGYAIWEHLQRLLDTRFKAIGVKNAYFPMFIPQSFIQKEKEHVKGFSPECAVVTHGGGAELEEPLIIRPTSETIINHCFARWVQSWRDLPLLINQWCNVVRWEMRPRLFLRTTEFLWQEGHTAHAAREEAEAFTLRILELYRDFVESELAIPVVTGEKSLAEKFAGAVKTYTMEAMMQDRRALQAGTSHFLGQTFSKAFGTRYQVEHGALEHVWQTSWGVSTRLVGGVVMTHGDDQGIVLPPAVAPVQAVIVPIWKNDSEKGAVLEAARRLRDRLLPAVRVELDDRDAHKPGWKYFYWEVRGVPLRVEIGPRDLERKEAMLVRRDERIKETVPLEGVPEAVARHLKAVQSGLLEKARAFRDRNTFEPKDYGDFRERVEGEGGFARVGWCGQGSCETMIKEETKATIRCLVGPGEGTKCFRCGQPASHRAVVARNY